MATERVRVRPSLSLPDPAWAPSGMSVVAVLALGALVALQAAKPIPAVLAGLVILAMGAALTWAMRRAGRHTPAARRAGAQTPAGIAPPLASIVEEFEDPVMVVSGEEPEELASRRLLLANAAARDLFRTTREAAPLVTVVRDPKVLEAVDEALYGGIDSEAIYEAGGVQGRVWRARARRLGDSDGRRLALVTLRDETEIRRSERMRADFLANASHELRTPLASLSGFIETLRGHARDDVEARDRFLGIMQSQAGRMARLIDDLLSLSRIELNEHIPPQGRVDVSLTVRDVLDALGPLAEERSLTFETRLTSAPTFAQPADRDQIVQVVQNLIENAMKYAAAGTGVGIEVVEAVGADDAMAPRRPGSANLALLTPDHAADQLYVALKVADRGPGIAREHLPRLTERFYRIEGQKPGERTGTGLGLAIVKHIMNRHRGGLAVESVLGDGAEFTVYFPMAAAATASAEGGLALTH
ncbi:MAG: sensor histidine kinase [Caulobacterales bacterium]